MPTRLRIWTLRQPTEAKMLRTAATPLPPAEIDQPDIQQLIDRMTEAMYRAHGIGLAAPQVGQSIQVAVIAQEVTIDGQPLVLINPSIHQASAKTDIVEEGCLSIPGVYGPVRRPVKITVTYLDRQGQPQRRTAQQLEARVIQHEIDHLHGRLFIDRAESITKGKELL